MIEAALRAILLADPTVASLVGTRIYTGIMPQRPTFPLITLKKIDKLSGLTLSDAVGPNTLRLQADCWANDVDGVRALADAVNGSDDQSNAGPLHGYCGGGSPLAGVYGYWPLDEAAGSSRLSIQGIAPDLLEVGGAVSSTPGHFGSAASSTEAATAGLAATLAPAVAVSAGLTIAHWFKWPLWSSASLKAILGLDDGGYTAGNKFISITRYFNSNFLDVAFRWAAGSGFVALPIPRLGEWSLNIWHLFVLTYDPSTGTLIGRVDDGCMSSAIAWAGPDLPARRLEAVVPPISLAAANASTFSTLRALKAFDGSYVSFEGAIDDLRIWPNVLTPAQIQNLWISTRINLVRLLVERSTEYESDTKLYRVSADYAVHL